MRLAVIARRALGLALAVAVAAAIWSLQVNQDRPPRPVAAPVGPLAWPFQGSAAVASARQSMAAYTMAPAIASYVAQARAHGRRVSVGQPRALFASHYAPGAIDVVVELAPVTGAGAVVALAGLYSADQSHEGTDSVALVHAGDQAISGDVQSFLFKAEHPVTVVVGGPRAGGILVSVDGGNTGPNGLTGAQVTSDPRGIAWIYDAVPRTLAAPTNGVISVTDGNGDYEHLLYYGPPAATPTGEPPSSLGWAS